MTTQQQAADEYRRLQAEHATPAELSERQWAIQRELTAERVKLAEQRTEREVPREMNYSAQTDEDEAQMAAIRAWKPAPRRVVLIWLGIVACVVLGALLAFVCLPWAIAHGPAWTPWGALFGLVLLALAWAATDAMGRRGGGR